MVPCKWCGRALHEPQNLDGWPDRRPNVSAKETGGKELYHFHRVCWDSIMRLHEVPPKPPERPEQAQQQPQAQPGVHRVPPGLRPPGTR